MFLGRLIRRLFKKPIWEHNCDNCVFLGHFKGHEGIYDLYVCEEAQRPTVLARFGNASHAYSSGLAAAGGKYPMSELREAFLRAKNTGYLKDYTMCSVCGTIYREGECGACSHTWS